MGFLVVVLVVVLVLVLAFTFTTLGHRSALWCQWIAAGGWQLFIFIDYAAASDPPLNRPMRILRRHLYFLA